MSSLTRSEYRHEEQRRVTESPFKETKWDRHLDTLLTDLNESVGSSRSPAGTQQRAVVPAGGPGVVTEVRGAPGSGDFHERREYVSPDQRTHVVQERFERTSRGDAGVPGRLFVSNRYETNNELTTNRWPPGDYGRGSDYGPARRAHDLRSPDALRSEPDYSRGYGPPRGGHDLRSPDALRSEPDYSRGYGPPRRGHELPDDLRSEPDYSRGYEPEPLWRGRAGSMRSESGALVHRPEPTEPLGRRYGSARAPQHGRRSPPYAEVYRAGGEPYGYSRPYQAPGAFARALSPVQPSAANRPTNYGGRFDSNQAVTKQVYKTSYSGDSAPQPIQDGVDPAVQTFDGPAGTSTPYRHTNVSKTTKTSKYTTSGGPAPDPTTLTPGDQLTVMGLTGPRHSPSPNPLEGLDRNLVPELSEPPQPGTTRVTKYEYRSSNRREVSPQPVPAPAPARTLPPPESTRSYVDRREYTSATNTLEHPPPPDTTDKTVTYNVYNTEQQVPQPPVVPGQPGSNTTINYHIYNYGTLGPDGQPVLPPGVLPPGSAPPSAPGTLPRHEVNTNTSTTSSTYRYREQSPPVQKSPAPGTDTTISNSYVFEKHSQGAPPPRSAPSPAPAPGPPGPPGQPGAPGTSYSTSTVTKHYTIGPDGREVPVRPVSPYDQQYPKFPVDEPPQGHHTRTTTTTIERTQTHGSPFPARSPSPSGRRPQRDDGPRVPFPGSPRRPVDDIDTPRRVDELMAQIPDTPQDGTYPHGPRRRDLNGRSSTTTTHFTVHETEPLMDTQTKVTLDAKSGAVVPQAATKPMAGPPIYYPPGSTEFKPKPESEMMFQSYESRGGGKYKSGYKAKGKYKAKGGSKESHAEGGAVIPICLPLCCGAACSVM
ncbi:trithorax group protein osa-like [Pollicipes pollicipes]|uniref:trithorax group protein osa-like n=1 Tax=Pollicipes pollicipes TaxID=41117 RepID=UPI00188502FB|nr:trithorax group protein osa-like [Pollicipes pollicipes]